MSSHPKQRPNAAAQAREVTDDAFLDGRVKLWQPKDGFRAGLDSVMLAAAVPARAKESVVELGLGVGTAALCVSARVPGVKITGVEIDRELGELALANAARNGVADFTVEIADVLKRPRSVKRQGFDHVMSNPPYHDAARGTAAPHAAKARATAVEKDALAAWLSFARALTKPKGSITVILPPEQLQAALSVLTPQGTGAEVFPLWPKAGEAAKRLIVRVRMNSRAAFVLRAGLALHDSDGTPSAGAVGVLRRGEALIR